MNLCACRLSAHTLAASSSSVSGVGGVSGSMCTHCVAERALFAINYMYYVVVYHTQQCVVSAECEVYY